MSRFVITITPDDAAAGGADSAYTTVRVDTSTGQARITELTVRAQTDGGLAPTDLPPIDLGLLITALTVAGQPQALQPATPISTPTSAADRVAESSEPPAANPAPTSPVPTSAAPRRRARKAAAQTAPAKKATGSKSAARKAPAKKPSTAKKATAAKSTAAATAGHDPAPAARAYRRMPEPEQVMDVYRQTGSITAVAEHFGVPRHTIAGWARRLRSQGHSIGRQ
ncbi:hypothetical protein GCM10022251_75210 [Phytohabitans flavus]|uniref:Uncharacterized protein n=1 Tax=Phytohabitans flavus TaxID=1076124 RepID=A0A6F8XLG0_9ACTN|nr:helix-turn-helix domain-containing protein [Phytohabitans flavus]BCB74621.1 hypothetical protein Pflav_010310 [Phytohabitans flavus]